MWIWIIGHPGLTHTRKLPFVKEKILYYKIISMPRNEMRLSLCLKRAFNTFCLSPFCINTSSPHKWRITNERYKSGSASTPSLSLPMLVKKSWKQWYSHSPLFFVVLVCARTNPRNPRKNTPQHNGRGFPVKYS